MKTSLLTLAALMTCGWSMAQTFSGGSGTEDNPWLISNIADLNELDSLTNVEGDNGESLTSGRYFLLTDDITTPFTGMIGTIGMFCGHFDGDGHSITVDIQKPSESYVGLFGCVANGSVHDLAVRGDVSGNAYVGGVVGNPTSGAVLYNLANYAHVISSSRSLMACTGGVVGGIVTSKRYGSTGAEVRNCANYGIVECDGNCVGGVIGYSGQQLGNKLYDLANYGVVKTAATDRTAGVVGNPLYDDKVHRLVNFGTKSAEAILGCVGNANPTDFGELFYDCQMAYTINGNAMQEKYTDQLIGTQMQSDLGKTWVYTSGLLPRPNMDGLEESDEAVLYAVPVQLDRNDWVGNVTTDFRVVTSAPDGNVTWTADHNLVDIATDGTVTIKRNGYETLTATYKGVSRKIDLVLNSATAINAVSSDAVTNDRYYNLNGQVVAHPTHGVFIHNGKKIVR